MALRGLRRCGVRGAPDLRSQPSDGSGETREGGRDRFSACAERAFEKPFIARGARDGGGGRGGNGENHLLHTTPAQARSNRNDSQKKRKKEDTLAGAWREPKWIRWGRRGLSRAGPGSDAQRGARKPSRRDETDLVPDPTPFLSPPHPHWFKNNPCLTLKLGWGGKKRRDTHPREDEGEALCLKAWCRGESCAGGLCGSPRVSAEGLTSATGELSADGAPMSHEHTASQVTARAGEVVQSCSPVHPSSGRGIPAHHPLSAEPPTSNNHRRVAQG